MGRTKTAAELVAAGFRVGDVVRCGSDDGVVTSVFVGGVTLRCDGGHLWRRDDAECTLLRRPVRKGDRLRATATDTSRMFVFDRYEGDRAYYVDGGYDFIDAGHMSRRHADGTPIEPPTAAPAPVVASVAARFEQVQDLLTNPDGSVMSSEDALLGVVIRARDWTAPWRAFGLFDAEGQRQLYVAAPPPLARRLFDTDPEVVAFVERVSDATLRRLTTRWSAVTLRAHVVDDLHATDRARYGRALQTAWDRDEQGWRTRAEERAAAMGE